MLVAVWNSQIIWKTRIWMVSFPDKNLFVKVFKNEFFGPNQGPSRFLLGGQYLEGFFFLVGI